jgi:hypothetical protein
MVDCSAGLARLFELDEMTATVLSISFRIAESAQ